MWSTPSSVYVSCRVHSLDLMIFSLSKEFWGLSSWSSKVIRILFVSQLYILNEIPTQFFFSYNAAECVCFLSASPLPAAAGSDGASDLLQVVSEHVHARCLSRGCPAFALFHNQQWNPACLSSELLYSVAEWLPDSWLVNIVTIIITIDLIFTAVYFWIFLFYVSVIICYFSKPFESLMKSENQILLPIFSCEKAFNQEVVFILPMISINKYSFKYLARELWFIWICQKNPTST